MRIGILQAGHVTPDIEARHGDFPSMFADLLAGAGHAFRTWSVVDMDFPGGPGDADAWLITGSKHGAYEDHPFIPPLEAFVREVHAARVPLVGICFGHQIVAQTMGGRVEKVAQGWGLGRTAYEVEGLGRVHLNAWHQDQVVEMPPGGRVVGRSDHCPTAAIAYGEAMWTIQPHPEFSGAVVADYASARRGTLDYPDDRMDAALAAADLPLDCGTVAAHMLRVLTGARTPADA